jgi:hypothetical protein
MASSETLLAYLSQLSGNRSVQADVDYSWRSARAAYRRAREARDLKRAAADPRVRRRIWHSVLAARSAVDAIRRGPEIEQRRRRRRPVLLAGAAIAGATALALYPDLRNQLSRPPSADPA